VVEELLQFMKREGVAQTVNAGITLLYWRIGKRIQTEILGNQRADDRKEILATLSQELTEEFGSGFSEKNLRRMIQFAEVSPDSEIVVSLIRQLSWTHILALIPLDQDDYLEAWQSVDTDEGLAVAKRVFGQDPKSIIACPPKLEEHRGKELNKVLIA